MLANCKMSLVEGPPAIEKRQQRQAIAAARAARAVQHEEARYAKSATGRSKPSRRPADAERAAAEQAARDAAEQAERNALFEAEQSGPRCPLRGTEGRQEATAAGVLARISVIKGDQP